MRYFAYFSYNGTAYHGWQFQPNALSVQEVLEKTLSTILRQPTSVVGAGRTDTGVHAMLMVAHFDFSELLSPTELQTLAFKLNGLLPADIAIKKIVRVRNDAHARFDARSRKYEYWLTQEKSAFCANQITHTYLPLNFEAMNDAAQVLLEETDFASFCKSHTDVKTTLCDVRQAYWETRPLPFSFPSSFPTTAPSFRSSQCHVFTIEADRFLRNMVRAVVGTLVEVGRGRLTKEQLRQIIHSKSRCAAGQSMPPDGLYLVDIVYPDDIFMV